MNRSVTTVHVHRDAPRNPKGPDRRELAHAYIRHLIARSVGLGDAATFASNRWGADSMAARIVKSGVSATDTADALTTTSVGAEFFRLVVEQSIVGRLDQARRVAFNKRFLVPSQGSRGYWVGESNQIPISKWVLTGDSLAAMKTAALVVLTNEALQDPANEERTIDDVTRAVVLALDEAFIDASNAGTDSMPAAVTNGATPISSTNNPATDIAALVEDFAGDLDAAVLVTDPTTATLAALARDAAGAFVFPNLGPRGGSAVNIPVLTSRASPRDSSGGQLALIDGGGIAVALEGLDLVPSTAGTINMSDDPEGESVVVALFQNELTAIRGTLFGNWKAVRAGAVSVVTGASYGTTAA